MALIALILTLAGSWAVPGTHAATPATMPNTWTLTSAPNTWMLTGAMAAARTGQTATLLQNGTVLVAGGGVATAELYDPATRTFTPTGAMSVPRSDDTATLLPDGTVLVTGGCNDRPCAGAEIYSPVTGTWSATGAMTAPRWGHSATLLPDGQVLVAGGGCLLDCHGPSGYSLSSTELYDPQTGTWAATGAMTTGRQYHTAILLPGGKVLVAGGFGGCTNNRCTDTNSAELYDPASATWTPTAAMSVGREHHTATLLLSGKVLVAGGANNGSGTLSSAELYDPLSGTWSSTGHLVYARSAHTATLLPGGKVLVAGGGTATSELYDPATRQWSAAGPLSTLRSRHTATLLANYTVLVTGGQDVNQVLASAEVFSPGAGPLVRVEPAALGFANQRAGSQSPMQVITMTNSGNAPLNVSGVAISGTDTGDFTNTTGCTAAPVAPGGICTVAVAFAPTATGARSAVLQFDDNAPSSPQLVSLGGFGVGPNIWVPAGTMSTLRQNHTATLLPDGKVLVAGGTNFTCFCDLTSAELYDPATGTFSQTGQMAAGRAYHTATLLPDGEVLAAGGQSGGGPIAGAELYDPATATWSATGSMAVARENHTATLLPDGKVLVAGGGVSNGAVYSSTELYDPAGGTWTPSGAMSTPRLDHTATLLPDSEVLAAGGLDAKGNDIAAAELYNPASDTWTATGAMPLGRHAHTATLLDDGKVLVAGGATCASGTCRTLAGALLYDPATGTWTPTNAMTTPRQNHIATLLADGRVLVSGGEDNGRALAGTEVYDPNTRTWSATAPMSVTRLWHTATALPDGTVLAAGGDCCASAEVYSPALLTVTPTQGRPGRRIALAGANFYAAEGIAIYWDSVGGTPLTSTVTAQNGAFTALAKIPAAAPGRHALIAVGQSSGASATAAFTVKR